MNNQPVLSIVIVNWNTAELLVRCLASLCNLPDMRPEVIVVDNASADDSVFRVRHDFPDVRLIENQENVGFSRANNQGANACSGKYLLLLNSDTEAPSDALRAMVEHMETHPDAGVLGPRLIGIDGRVQTSCRTEPGLLNMFLESTLLSRLFPWSRLFGRPQMTWCDHYSTLDVDYIQGACLLIRRELFTQLGGLDERFFFYGEDADLCRRARKAGFRVVFFAGAEILHVGAASAKRVAASAAVEAYRSVFLFCRKHHGGAYVFAMRLVALLGTIARLVWMSGLLPAALIARRGHEALGKIRTYVAVCRLLLSRDVYPRTGKGW